MEVSVARVFDGADAAGVALALLLCVACAQRVVPPTSGAPDEPRASWIIRAGTGNAGQEREICRSGGTKPCVLPVSAPAKPVTAVVSVFLYPAAKETTYQGAFLSGFIDAQGAAGYEAKVDYKIAPGKLPNAVSVAGRVTSKPGVYHFRMALLAAVPGRADPHQFQHDINVQVVPASAAMGN